MLPLLVEAGGGVKRVWFCGGADGVADGGDTEFAADILKGCYGFESNA